MWNFAKQGAAAMVVLAFALAAQPAGAQTGLPELQPCSPQMAATWQNSAFQKAVASSQSIQSTQERVAGNGEAGTGIGGTYQQKNKQRKKERAEDFASDETSCWSQVGDNLGGVIEGVLDGIAEGFGDLIPDIDFPEMGEIDLNEALCSATLRAENVLAGGIYVAARIPRIITDTMVGRVNWKIRGYRNYALWEQRRLERLPERRSRQKVRDWTHSADLPMRAPWGHPATLWPANWNQGAGG